MTQYQRARLEYLLSIEFPTPAEESELAILLDLESLEWQHSNR